MTVFPQRNLPGNAEPWGRAVENRIESVERRISVLGSDFGNDGRFTSGQLAVFGSQINEQVARTTLVETPADLSVSGNATIEPFPRASRTITFPDPGGSRVAQVEVYAEHANANSGSATVYAYLSHQGSIVSKLTWMLKSNNVVEFGAVPRIGSGVATVVLPPDTNPVFTLTVVRVGFTSASSTETLTNIRAFLTPFQKTV